MPDESALIEYSLPGLSPMFSVPKYFRGNCSSVRCWLCTEYRTPLIVPANIFPFAFANEKNSWCGTNVFIDLEINLNTPSPIVENQKLPSLSTNPLLIRLPSRKGLFVRKPSQPV